MGSSEYDQTSPEMSEAEQLKSSADEAAGPNIDVANGALDNALSIVARGESLEGQSLAELESAIRLAKRALAGSLPEGDFEFGDVGTG